MTKTHVVKSWTNLFQPIWDGKKLYDLRDATDRHYQVGDFLELREFDFTKGVYTGRTLTKTITYITDRNTPCALSSMGIQRGLAIIGLSYENKDSD